MPPTETPVPPTETLVPPTETPVPPTETPVPPTEPPPPPTEPPPPPTEPPAPAPGNVVIDYIFYDGVVPRVESDEYAVIANYGGTSVSLSGWNLYAGDPGQDFWFPAMELAPGATCLVYTNEIYANSCGGRSFGRGQAIWNNDGDCGFLYGANGELVDEYCY